MTSVLLSQHRHGAFQRLLQRLQGLSDVRITCSYSNRNLSDDSLGFPSSILLQLGLETASPSTTRVAFLHRHGSKHLRALDTELVNLLQEPSETIRTATLHERYPHLLWQQVAMDHQASELFTAYDGLVPDAGRDLLESLATRPMSPSRLETLGACPRKYFFSRALGIAAPEQFVADPDRWLSSLQMGSLLHELFESFWWQKVDQEQTIDASRDLPELMALLSSMIAKWQEIVPVQHVDAFVRQQDELQECCEIFLEKEAEYCGQRAARPWVMEATLGGQRHEQVTRATLLDTESPIEVTLPNGRTLKLGGRIDRIDRVGDASEPKYLIWDYKTGSNFGYDQGNPFDQGRKLQPLLYGLMLQRRLAALKLGNDNVLGFGYFFPNPKCEGQRIEWSMEQLKAGQVILASLFDLLDSGIFIATTKKDDCTYCDYARVCGPAEELVQISLNKTHSDDKLSPWKSLRPKTK